MCDSSYYIYSSYTSAKIEEESAPCYGPPLLHASFAFCQALDPKQIISSLCTMPRDFQRIYCQENVGFYKHWLKKVLLFAPKHLENTTLQNQGNSF